MWGPKGLFTTHASFEMGVATLIAPLSFGEALPTKRDIKRMQKIGVTEWFRRTAREVAVLGLYDAYYQKGWTPKLAYDIRHKLGPAMVQTVVLTWYMAALEAGVEQPH
jgi:hypothetical protein